MSTTAPPPIPIADRTAHPFHTHDMIQEIPASYRDTLRRLANPAREAATRLADRSVLAFTGCGTASYSARLAAHFAATSSERIRSAAMGAFELSNYASGLGPSWGVVGISHSGITKTTVEALRQGRARGALTIGVTHFLDRPISGVSDVSLIAGNGPDLSRCHTKCYVAGALAGAQIALEWRAATHEDPRSRIESIRLSLETLPDFMDDVLRSTEKMCEELAADHLTRRSVGIFGAGPNLPTALEAALKIRETSFLPAEGMEIEEYLHGSWQSLDSESLLFVVAPSGPSHARAVDLARAARIVGATVVAVVSEGEREMEGLADTVIAVPPVDELLSPFLNIIPLYLYAYYSSVKRGHNPDLLRYLEPRYWEARQIVFPPGTH